MRKGDQKIDLRHGEMIVCICCVVKNKRDVERLAFHIYQTLLCMLHVHSRCGVENFRCI